LVQFTIHAGALKIRSLSPFFANTWTNSNK
jgi:hypothetical protein